MEPEKHIIKSACLPGHRQDLAEPVKVSTCYMTLYNRVYFSIIYPQWLTSDSIKNKETKIHINVWPEYLLRLKWSNVIFLNRLYSIPIFNVSNRFTSTNWASWGAEELYAFSYFSCFLPSAVIVSSSHKWEASHKWQESQESHCFLLFDWRWRFKILIRVHIHSSHFHFLKPTG